MLEPGFEPAVRERRNTRHGFARSILLHQGPGEAWNLRVWFVRDINRQVYRVGQRNRTVRAVAAYFGEVRRCPR